MSIKSDLKQAKKLISTEQYAESLVVLDSVIEIEPENTSALLMKGVAQQRLNLLDDALVTLKSLLSFDQTNFMAWRALVPVYERLHDAPELFEAIMQTIYYLATEPRQVSVEDAVFQAAELFVKLKKSTRKTDSEIYERVLELQVVLPPDIITEANTERRNIVHDLLQNSKPSVFDSDSLRKLQNQRFAKVQKQQRMLQLRAKQVVGFSASKLFDSKLEVLNSSKIVELMRLRIDTEHDDTFRREVEAQLLELLNGMLKEAVQPVNRTSSKERATELSKYIDTVRSEVLDLSERMAMFEPFTPLAWELVWDFNELTYEEVTLELCDANAAKDGENSKNDSIKKQLSKHKNRLRQQQRPQRFKSKEDLKRGKEKKNENLKGSNVEAQAVINDKDQDEKAQFEETVNGSDQDEFKDNRFVHCISKYMSSFPDQPLASVFLALVPTSAEPSGKKLERITSYKGDSVLGYLMCAHFCLNLSRYEEAIDHAHAGLRALAQRLSMFSVDMSSMEGALQLALAESYSHYQAPKNWGMAANFYDKVLNQNPDNFEAILGKGVLLAQSGSNSEATRLLELAKELQPNNISLQNNLSWLYVQQGDRQRGLSGLQRCLSIENSPKEQALIHWRIGYTLWAFPESEEERESCYEHFVAALESCQTFAPAYTYLGLFYEDIVGDKERSQRCFCRALELDSGELIAGERLAKEFSESSQWDLVEVVANTVLSSSKARDQQNLDWPYRALGISFLNQLKYAEAVKYFQKCLRYAKNDALAWTGLGEAYIYSGRYNSAEKALTRSLKLQPENFSAWYVLSLAQRETLRFPESAASLQMAIKYSPDESVALQWAMCDNSLRAADYFLGECLIKDALNELAIASTAILKGAEKVLEDHSQFSIFYGSTAEVFLQFDRMGYAKFDDLPSDLDSLKEQFKSTLLCDVSIDTSFLSLAVSAANRFVELSSQDTKIRRVAAHSIAALASTKASDWVSAVSHYQSAIQLEPRNDDLWNSYGVCLIHLNPEVAQHCFVRSLTLNGRNVDTWVNMAGLYLNVKDYDLALEAVDRALSLEPDHCRAWIAQALAETALGTRSNDHLYRTFEYAYSLSANDELASFALALKEYEMQPESPSAPSLGALDKIMTLNPNNKSARIILGLLLERQGSYESSLEHLIPLEEWVHAARVQMALGSYRTALESCSRTNSLKSSIAEKLSVLLTSGLCHYFLNNFDDSIEAFTEALDVVSAKQSDDVLRLLVEVLVDSQDEEAQKVAQDQLFGSIDEHGASLQVTLLLGALGFLNKDEAIMEAARSELETMITPELRGEPLAQACHILNLLDPTNCSFQRAVFQWPNDYSLWRRVDKKQALIIAECQTTNPEQLSRALIEAGGTEITNFQRAVFYEPTNEATWHALATNLRV